MHRWSDQLCSVIYITKQTLQELNSHPLHIWVTGLALLLFFMHLSMCKHYPCIHTHPRTHRHTQTLGQKRKVNMQPFVLKWDIVWRHVTGTVTTLMQRGALIMISHPCPNPSAKSVKRKCGGSETTQLSINHLLTLTCVSPLWLLR